MTLFTRLSLLDSLYYMTLYCMTLFTICTQTLFTICTQCTYYTHGAAARRGWTRARMAGVGTSRAGGRVMGGVGGMGASRVVCVCVWRGVCVCVWRGGRSLGGACVCICVCMMGVGASQVHDGRAGEWALVKLHHGAPKLYAAAARRVRVFEGAEEGGKKRRGPA